MKIEEKIEQGIKAAMFARDTDKKNALGSLKTAILVKRKEKGGNVDITEDDIVVLVQKQIKTRKESAEIFKQQNREDLLAKEFNEISVLEEFLPAQLDASEIEVIITKIIGEANATSLKDMGKVMGLANKELAGKADGKTISDIVKKLLN